MLFSRNSEGVKGFARMAEKAGLVDAALNGHDINAAIGLETSERRLTRLLNAATQHQESHWAEVCVARLFELNPSPAVALQRAELLLRRGNLDEAEQIVSGLDPSSVASGKYRMVCASLDAKRGRVPDAVETFVSIARSAGSSAPALAMLDTIDEMLSQADLEPTARLIALMREHFPDSLGLRSLDLGCAMLEGRFADAEEAAAVPGLEAAAAPVHERRMLLEATATLFGHLGWHYQVVDFALKSLERDPTHWNLYMMASEAAKATSQGPDYEEAVAAIPKPYRKMAGALAVICKLHSDEHRHEAADAALAALRKVSAHLYLVSRRYIAATRGTEAEVAEACEECDRCGLPALPSALIRSMCGFHLRPSEETAGTCVEQLRPFKAEARRNTNFWQLYLRCLIALRRDAEAGRELANLPAGIQKAARLEPFRLYFEAESGEAAQVRSGWTRYLREVRHPCINARESYPEALTLKYREKAGQILLFSTVYNGAEYLDWFLDYYRRMGIDHFIMTDNASSDGTRERLESEDDVSVFLNEGSYGRSAYGTLWINHLQQRFGTGHWCLNADIDEGFVFPRYDSGRTLRDLVGYADANGFRAFGAVMVDMYPDTFERDGRPADFASCTNFDDDYSVARSELPPYFVAQGGIRQRLTGLGMAFQKVPLVRVERDFRYVDCCHSTTHVPIADIRTALLHYKFIGDTKARTQEAISRGEHFASASTYIRFAEAAEQIGWSGSLSSPHSRKYTGDASLEEAGIMESSAAWEAFDIHRTPPRAGRAGRIG